MQAATPPAHRHRIVVTYPQSALERDTDGARGPSFAAFALLLCALCAALFLSGCAWNAPPTTTHQPMTARAAPASEDIVHPGAIYQPGTARLALNEDRRARFVGDTLTIVIEERTTASKASSGDATRTSDLDIQVPSWQGVPGKTFQGIDVQASTSNEFEGEGNAASNNLFNGNLSVTVIEVLENGNLLVSGEKQVTINRGTEFIRFSGVVNPVNIGGNNTVSSTRVADARVEYRGTGYVAEASTMGWLSRFFMTVSPF
jgi:flagellar L-ring protein precursor FlgH